MIIMMLRNLTNQNNISSNNSIINIYNDTFGYKPSFVATFQESFPIKVPKSNV
jgi:hypothetical protein